jgi:hypothetical protein
VACVRVERNAYTIFIGYQNERDHSEEAGDSIKTDRKEIKLEGVYYIFLAHDWEAILWSEIPLNCI